LQDGSGQTAPQPEAIHLDSMYSSSPMARFMRHEQNAAAVRRAIVVARVEAILFSLITFFHLVAEIARVAKTKGFVIIHTTTPQYSYSLISLQVLLSRYGLFTLQIIKDLAFLVHDQDAVKIKTASNSPTMIIIILQNLSIIHNLTSIPHPISIDSIIYWASILLFFSFQENSNESRNIVKKNKVLELIIINYNMYRLICNKYILYNGLSNYIRNEVIKFYIGFIICYEK
jgi:hypothetical protein